MQMPLNKFISLSGVASRRKAVDLIKDGAVRVNGTVETNPAYPVQPKDHVRLQGKPVVAMNKKTILLNKPKNCITTVSDPSGRPTVMHLIPPHLSKGLFPVGRLDGATTGLLILTNDGALAQKLAHPSKGILKVYRATFAQGLDQEKIDTLMRGAWLEDGYMKPDWVRTVRNTKKQIDIAIHSGKNRIIRRLCLRLQLRLKQLERIQYGQLRLNRLKKGGHKLLSPKEIALLLAPRASSKA